MINQDIFKKYDIRGRYPEDFNIDCVERLVRAYVKLFKPQKVILAHDPLEGSQKIYPLIIEEFQNLGVDIHIIGMASSPMLYFAAAFYDIRHGIILTASHQGVGHTGMKMIIDGIPISHQNLMDMKNIVLSSTLEDLRSNNRGNLVEINGFYDEYVAKLLEITGSISGENDYEIIIDSGNGPNGVVIRKILERTSIEYELINEEVKSKDLAHETNPKIEKNRSQLVKQVLEQSADLGIIWDGDGDRAYFIDWRGIIIPPEYVGIQIGKLLLSKGKGKKITTDVRSSRCIEDFISKNYGEVIRLPAWHVPIKHEMEKDTDIVFGMETSGHYVFRDMYKSDDGLLAALLFIKSLIDSDISIQEDLTQFRSKYKILEEINFVTQKSESEIVHLVKEKYRDADLDDIDGITVEYPDLRFNIRSSKSEPLIRLNISGTNFERLDTELENLKAIIGGYIDK